MSNLSAFAYIAEGSQATPGLFNRIFSTLSDNIGALNSDLTLYSPSGDTFSILSHLTVGGRLSVKERLHVGTNPSSSTLAQVVIGVSSAQSDYLLMTDTSDAHSDFLWSSRVGPAGVDGLKLWDASGDTMLVNFSKSSIRFFQNVVGPVFDVGGALADTYNAATYGTGADSVESRIQAAISQASIDGVSRVYVPANMYPYSAASISFDTRVQMVREGGNWGVYDVQAYGAFGDNVHTDWSAFTNAINGARWVSGTVYCPSPTSGYRITAQLDLPANTALIGENKFGTRLVHANSGGTMFTMGGGATMELLYLDGNGTNFDGRGIVITTGNGKQRVASCRITGFTDRCVDFNHEAAGSQSIWIDCELSTLTGTAVGQEAVVIRGTLTAAANPRTFIGIQTQGLRFIDLGPCNNVLIVASRPAGITWNTASRGVVIAGCREAVADSSIMTILGANHAISSCDIAEQVALGAGCQNVTVRGNTYNTLPIIDAAFDATNIIEDYKDVNRLVTFTAGDTTPSVGQGRFFQTANASVTTITDFDDGVSGQRLTVRLDSNTGIAHNNSFIRLHASQSVPAGFVDSNDYVNFVDASGIWFEESRSFGQPYFTAFNNSAWPDIAWRSEKSLGFYRSGSSRIALSYGQLQFPDGSNTTPSTGYTSETSLGFYRSGASTIAISRGTFNLATNAVRLSMRTIAASALTASAANTNVATNEVVFTVGGASGASLAIHSGGTVYIFNSALSAAAA